MRKQKNKRGKLSRKHFSQTIEEAKWNYKDKPNPRYPGRKTITHTLTASDVQK